MRWAARAISLRAEAFVLASTGACASFASASRSRPVVDVAGAAPAAASAAPAAAMRSRPLTLVTPTVCRSSAALLGFPGGEQLLDVAPLCVDERHPRDDPPRLCGLVVRDRRFEP